MSVNLNPVGDTINEPYLIIDNFLASHVAGNMRADIEQHFADPFAHLPQSHQVWNYWYVPGQYTYFRTNAEKVVHHERVEYFLSALRNWSTRTLGLSKITRPYLSLYMNGCSQKWHNDALNGRFAFVYSLTANERKSSGGGTVIMNEGDHFRNHLTSPAAGSAFFVEIEPVFNRLIVFDDRLPHAVEPVLSSMDPLDGRFVLHGHISEGESQVEGGSDPGEVSSIMTSAADIVFSKYSLASRGYHGPFVVRLEVGENGRVGSCCVVLDRVVTTNDHDVDWATVRAALIEDFRDLRFPESPTKATITHPLIVGRSLQRDP
jgi:hypothetical protein